MVKFLKAGRNIIITRTFSKIFGMAGLRIGYLLAQPDLVKYFEERFMIGFSGNAPNTVSTAAALAALDVLSSIKWLKRITLLKTVIPSTR